MATYQSANERSFSDQCYTLEKNRSYEALNFLRRIDGLFRGYAPGGSDARKGFGKIAVSHLGAAKGENRAFGVTVIFGG